jgi:hypothetical protein
MSLQCNSPTQDVRVRLRLYSWNQEVVGSNLGRHIDLSFVVFLISSAKFQNVGQNHFLPNPLKFVILPFNVTQPITDSAVKLSYEVYPLFRIMYRDRVLYSASKGQICVHCDQMWKLIDRH